MKTFTSIISLLLILFTSYFYKIERPNDLKIYGLNGKVKTIKSIGYGSKKENNNWRIDKEQILYKSFSYFNQDGNIFKSVDSIYEKGKVIEVQTTEYEFQKNGDKEGYRIYNQKKPLEYGKITWIDNKNYKIDGYEYFKGDSIKTKSVFLLTDTGRDKKGETKYYYDDDHIYRYTYVNELDSNENFISSTFKYEDSSWTTLYKREKPDKKDNPTIYYLIDKEKDSLKEVRISKLTYFQ